MDLKIKYSTNFELERVKITLKKLDWYSSQDYKINLPEGIDKNSKVIEIKKKIIKEYNKQKFDKYKSEVEDNFNKISKEYYETLTKVFGKVPKKFELCLTNYGVGGSYNAPNIIIKNINNSKEGIKTVVHEIMHLMIQRWIDEYNVKHWEKERIVELILNSEQFKFLNYNYWQPDYRRVEKYIDPLFKKEFFKNPKDFFGMIALVR